MILGIGTDIIEIQRIEEVIKRTPSFLNKSFTDEEIKLFNKKGMRSETIAGNFAVKEALSKAIGSGIRGFNLKDIEVLRDELGKPIVRISQTIKDILNNRDVIIHATISHNRSDVVAFVVMEEA